MDRVIWTRGWPAGFRRWAGGSTLPRADSSYFWLFRLSFFGQEAITLSSAQSPRETLPHGPVGDAGVHEHLSLGAIAALLIEGNNIDLGMQQYFSATFPLGQRFCAIHELRAEPSSAQFCFHGHAFDLGACGVRKTNPGRAHAFSLREGDQMCGTRVEAVFLVGGGNLLFIDKDLAAQPQAFIDIIRIGDAHGHPQACSRHASVGKWVRRRAWATLSEVRGAINEGWTDPRVEKLIMKKCLLVLLPLCFLGTARGADLVANRSVEWVPSQAHSATVPVDEAKFNSMEWFDSWFADGGAPLWYTPEKYEFVSGDTLEVVTFLHMEGETQNFLRLDCIYICGQNNPRNFVMTGGLVDFGLVPEVQPNYGHIFGIAYVIPPLPSLRIDSASRHIWGIRRDYGLPLSGRPDCATIN